MSDTPTGLTAVPKIAGPFSPDRYTERDALSVGLPSPEGLNLLVKFAEQMVGTPFIPKALANGPNPAGNILAVVLTGREEGFSPLEALRSYWISPDGRLAKYADAMMAKMRRNGFLFPVKEFTNDRACLKGIRPDGEDYQSTFTFEDAKRAGLTGKDIWQKYPQRMLKARVIGDVYRFLAADLGGPTYAAEELQDIEPPTTDEPTEADAQRAAVLDAKYSVKVKTPAPPDPPIEANLAPPVLATTPASSATPETQPLQYEVHVLLPTAGGGKPKPVLLPDETMENQPAASLRAQALANKTGQPHIVVEFDPNTGERHDVDHCHPPKFAELAPSPAPAPAEAPVAAHAVAQEPPQASAPAATGELDPNAPKARLDALAITLGIPNKTAMARFTAYMAGFIGCPLKDFKATAISARLEALESLEYLIAYDANEFSAGPEESGKRRRKYKDSIKEYLTKTWPKPTDAATVSLALKLAQKWGTSPPQFEKWLTMEGIALDFLSPIEDVHAVLRVLMKTREGISLLKLNRDHNMSIAKSVEQIETRALMCPIEEAPENSVKSAIESYLRAVKEEAKRKSEPPSAAPAPEPANPKPEPNPPAAEQEEEGNLFGGSDW